MTAALTTGLACVKSGLHDCTRLMDRVLATDHTDWESTMFIGDEEYFRTKKGPFPNHQLRISVDPLRGFAAIAYMDHDDLKMPLAYSLNPRQPAPQVDLIFSGATGAFFPRTCAIPLADARQALIEWLNTRKRPNSIKWCAYGAR